MIALGATLGLVDDPAGAVGRPGQGRSPEVKAVERRVIDACLRAGVPPRVEIETPDEAAYYLSRRPQTLRGWACHEDGPIRPLRINRRLAWPVSELRKLLGAA